MFYFYREEITPFKVPKAATDTKLSLTLPDFRMLFDLKLLRPNFSVIIRTFNHTFGNCESRMLFILGPGCDIELEFSVEKKKIIMIFSLYMTF